jgi:hypothetical protein
MQTLNIDLQTAKKIYPSSQGEFKSMLEKTFTVNVLSENIKDRVKTFEDAASILGIDLAAFNARISGYSPDAAAYEKIKVIVKALNEGWSPNWTDDYEYKYYPWFDLSSGSGLSCFVYVCRVSHSCVGSRLCFKTADLAEYAGRQFVYLYSQFFLS